jgi:uncharacterized coiled-coil protein SlyX
MSDNRFSDIETKLAHIEQQFEDLNGVVLEQAASIRKLKTKLSQAEGKIEELESGKDEGGGLSSIEIAAQSKPPHY